MHCKFIAAIFLAIIYFDSVYSTEFLAKALKENVPKIRCKLHAIGSKLFPHHTHRYGDPCEPEEVHNHGGEFGQQPGFGFQHLNGHSYGPLNPNDGEPNVNGFYPPPPKPLNNRPHEESPTDNNYYNVDPLKPGYQEKYEGTVNFGGNSLSDYGPSNVDETSTISTGQKLDSFIIFDNVQTTEKSNIMNVENNELIFKDDTSSPNIKQEVQITTENYPAFPDIDLRVQVEEKSTTARSAKSYATVPTGVGRNIGKAPCKNGMVMTSDGCMEEI